MLPGVDEKLKALEAKRRANGGWSESPPVKEFKEYPLFTSKRALKESIRYHIMRFNRAKEDKPVDPTDQEQFPRPVSLHRRDPRLPPAGRMIIKEEVQPLNPVDEAEAARLKQLKAEKEAQRAIDLAQIAPVAKPSEPKATKQNKKEKALSTYYPKHTEEAKKQVGLRYEETLPWHLEDVDGKNVWVGSYVAALSEVNVALVISGGGFRMIPLERYYKFNSKPAFNMLSLEEAERMMGKNASEVGRWVMKDKERAEADKEYADYRHFLSGPARVKVESSTSRAMPKAEKRDDNDIDMSGDEFQDDDEAPGFEADDEDARDAKDRMRRDHLGANLFGAAEEDEVDKEEEEEKLEKRREKVQGKRTRRNLAKLEHAMEYDSDSDSDNPFAESSVSLPPCCFERSSSSLWILYICGRITDTLLSSLSPTRRKKRTKIKKVMTRRRTTRSKRTPRIRRRQLQIPREIRLHLESRRLVTSQRRPSLSNDLDLRTYPSLAGTSRLGRRRSRRAQQPRQ
jgi:transcription initiation factor TFIIF subunit alpha